MTRHVAGAQAGAPVDPDAGSAESSRSRHRGVYDGRLHEQPEERRGALVTYDRAGTAGENGSHQAAVTCEPSGADDVDADVDAMKSPPLHPVLNRAGAEPELT
jgi:hypothetical protein